MINLYVSVDNASRTVTVFVESSGSDVTLFRRVGLAEEEVIGANLTVEDGVATYRDTSPPEKVLLTYAATNELFERSSDVNTVLPTSWQLTRPTLAGDIRLGDLVLNTIDTDGTVWTVADINGWWTLPEAEVPSLQRSREEDGSYDDEGRYLARNLTLTGVFLPKDHDQLESARAQLASRLNAVRQVTTLRVDETPPKQMFVRLSGKTRIETVRYSGLSEFAVELLAADPLKYSVDPIERPIDEDDREVVVQGTGVTSGGRTYPRTYNNAEGLRSYGAVGTPNQVRAYNYGTYSTPPHITIAGPVTGPRIELLETGQFMEFDTTLAEGEFLDIDVREKTVIYNNSVSRRGTMTFPSQWFRLVPGLNTLAYTAQSSPGNTSTVTVRAYSAWLG